MGVRLLSRLGVGSPKKDSVEVTKLGIITRRYGNEAILFTQKQIAALTA